MKTIFPLTQQILEAIGDVCDISRADVSAENKNANSDLVTLDKEHNVGFEVFENEIILFYFNDHVHFEDYTSAEPEEPFYPQRAIEALRQLFTCPLIKLETLKKGKVIRYEWFRQLPDERLESICGPWIIKVFTNPFVKKQTVKTVWYYSKDYGRFRTRPSDNTIAVINYDWDLSLEIRKENGVYSYVIMQQLFDEDVMDFYWNQVNSGASFFDSEEAAVEAAKAEAKAYRGTNPLLKE